MEDEYANAEAYTKWSLTVVCLHACADTNDTDVTRSLRMN